jgi:hypothetical protein
VSLRNAVKSFASRHRIAACVACASIIAASSALGLTRFAGHSHRVAVPAAEESNSAEHVDFNEPLLAGRKLSSVADAAADVRFKPAAPAAVGQPVSIWVPAQARQHLLALVYQHPRYGRFMVVEVKNIGSQQDLEGLVNQCLAGCAEQWSLIRLDDGSEAVVFEGSPSIPFETTGVIWIHNGLALNVLGLAAGFGRDAAVRLANLFNT